MESAVDQFIDDHQLIKSNRTILVGISGGPDSTALLHYLWTRRKRWNLKIIALTADHQLRDDAYKDVSYVKNLCEQLKIPCVETTLDVESHQKKNRLSTQVAARKLRYQFYKEQMKRFKAHYLTLGHHGDDQVETMLMSIVRSSSTRALSGIPLRRRFATGELIRPFLCVSKEDIEGYCTKYDLNPRKDPSNEDTTYMRNYFRKHLIPLIKEKNDRIHVTMQRLSEDLQRDEVFLLDKAKKIAKAIVHFDEKGKQATFNRMDFLEIAYPLQRRIYHLILNYLYCKLPYNLSYTHEKSFFSLLNSHKSHIQIDFPQHLIVEKSYQRVTLYFQEHSSYSTSLSKTIHIPGQITLPDGSILYAEYSTKQRIDHPYTYVCSVTSNDLPLYVRTRRPGDRMSWKGLNGSKKIKDIFIDEKIPHSLRDTWPIVTTKRGEILWLIGLKKGSMKKQNPQNMIRIKLTYQGDTKGGDLRA